MANFDKIKEIRLFDFLQNAGPEHSREVLAQLLKEVKGREEKGRLVQLVWKFLVQRLN